MDTLGVGEFLGQCEIDGSQIMFPNPDAVVSNLEKNPILGKKGNKLVQGSVKYKIVRQFSEGEARSQPSSTFLFLIQHPHPPPPLSQQPQPDAGTSSGSR